MENPQEQGFTEYFDRLHSLVETNGHKVTSDDIYESLYDRFYQLGPLATFDDIRQFAKNHGIDKHQGIPLSVLHSEAIQGARSRLQRERQKKQKPKDVQPFSSPITDFAGSKIPEPVLTRDTDEGGRILSVGGAAILSGAGGIGKSYITLALAMAAGEAEQGWAARCGIRVRPGPIYLVSYEDDPVWIRHRLDKLSGGNEDSLRHIAVWQKPQPLFTGGGTRGNAGPLEIWKTLWEDICEVRPSLVVIDPVSMALIDSSVNESGPVRMFLQELAAAATEAETAVLLVAHSTKAARGRDTDETDPGNVAGSATWFDAARGVLVFRNQQLFCAKSNHGPTGWKVQLRCNDPFDGWHFDSHIEEGQGATFKRCGNREKATLTFH